MKENKYWLNIHGERYWYLKTDMSKTARRSYYWVDRVTFIHEETTHFIKDGNFWSTSDRHYLNQKTYTQFKYELDKWAPIENFKQYARKLHYYYLNKERVKKINNLK